MVIIVDVRMFTWLLQYCVPCHRRGGWTEIFLCLREDLEIPKLRRPGDFLEDIVIM